MACPPASEEVNDLIECSICQEEFNDPRTLPCVHSFCMNCIRICGKDKRPGDVMSCPLCRECFKIPVDGIDGLPKNFLIKKIIEVKDAAFAPYSTPRPCETCCQDENGLPKKKKTAVVFCVECRQMLCAACEATHRKLSVSCAHECLKLGDGLAFVDMLKKLPDSHCAKHQMKKVELFCYDCKHTICLLCFIDSHKSHKCSAIETVVEEFRSQMIEDITNIGASISHNRDLLDQRMKEELEDVDCKFIKAEKEIKLQAKQMKRSIESERDKLLDELLILKQKRVTDVENAYNANDQHAAEVDQWKERVEELIKEGTAVDVLRDAAGLHDRATELLTSGGGRPKSLGTLSVVYTAPDRPISGTSNVLGKVDVRVTKPAAISQTTPMLISVLAEGDEVRAVTSLDDRLFVVRCPSEQQIEIYDVVTFTLQTPFFVANLSDDVRGMTSCDVIRCLYVSDCENKSIRRVDVASGRTFSWRTEGKPYGLSTNAAHNVLVTCPHKILEYTYLGLLVRRVELPSDVVLWAWHAIQLAAGRFVVNHLHVSSQHRVCIVDAMGRIVVQGQVPGSLTGQISSPLAVDKNGLVLVADSDNHRIMVLNPRLEWSQDLQIDADSSGIQGPCALHLDESRGRLYVGESADGRILVFDGVA